MFIQTTAPLQQNGAANSADTYNSGPKNMDRGDRVVGLVFADQAGTLFIEQSVDASNWDVSTSYSVSASDGKGFSEEVLAAFVRIRFVNTAGSPQTAFRLSARTASAGDS